jgi:hypothetical protein
MSCKYRKKFAKKIQMALMIKPGAWGKLIDVEKPEVNNLVALSL